MSASDLIRKVVLIVAGVLAGLSLSVLGLTTGQSNILGWLLAFVGLGYFFGGAIYLAAVGTSNAVRAEPGDRSIWLLAPGFIVVFWGSPLEYLYLSLALPRTATMQAIGLGLIALGLALRLWVRQSLGEMYTGHVQVLTKHRLVRTGPYHYLRHPGYTGFIPMALGMALGFSSLIGIVAVLVLMLPGLIYRMNVEERLLTEQFGDAYRAYARTTKRLIPGLW